MNGDRCGDGSRYKRNGRFFAGHTCMPATQLDARYHIKYVVTMARGYANKESESPMIIIVC